MKKTLSIILTLFLLFALTGCNGAADENDSTVETVIVEETIKAHANAQAVTSSGTLPELSAEDKAVKAEIAKYIDTKVDFRYNRQEVIAGKTFNIAFSKVDSASNYQRVIYVNEFGDEFVYNTYDGKLRYAVMESVAIEKTTKSIDVEKAKNIAEKYVVTICDLSAYVLDQQKEIDTGYYFCYTRYIGGYPSTDRFSIQIGYDGAIIYLSDFTDTFIGKDINYDKTFIDDKINKALSGIENAKISHATIVMNNEKVCVSFGYSIADEPSGVVTTIPLE